MLLNLNIQHHTTSLVFCAITFYEIFSLRLRTACEARNKIDMSVASPSLGAWVTNVFTINALRYPAELGDVRRKNCSPPDLHEKDVP